MPLPEMPYGWTVRGDLPTVDLARADEDELELLDEDLLQVAHPSEDYVLDVGWYPAGSRSGEFVCRLIARNDWSAPLEELRTREVEDVREWVRVSTADIADRMGEPAVIVPTPRMIEIVLQPPVYPALADAQDISKLPSADVSSSSGVVRTRMPEYAT